MIIPQLVRSERSREYESYSEEQRADVVIGYLFDGMSHRKLDRVFLGLDDQYSRGYQSMGILHYLGLVGAHKGIFHGLSIQSALSELQAAGSDYSKIADILITKIHG